MTTATQDPLALARKAKASAKSVDELTQEAIGRATSPLAKAGITRRIEQMPETCVRTYLRAISGKSLSAAVKSFCLECVGWQREAVTNCTSPGCPFYLYRPYRGKP